MRYSAYTVQFVGPAISADIEEATSGVHDVRLCFQLDSSIVTQGVDASWGAGRRSGNLDEDCLACLLGIPPVRRIVMLPTATRKEASGSHVYHSAVR